VAISSLSFQELGYLDEREKEDKNEGVHDEENIKKKIGNSEEREQK